MRQQMQQMAQLLQASNTAKAPESAYPCPNFGNVDFKRETTSHDDVSNNNNNNTNMNDKNLDKEKLWSMYLAGQVSLDGKEVVKSESGISSSSNDPQSESHQRQKHAGEEKQRGGRLFHQGLLQHLEQGENGEESSLYAECGEI